MQFSWTLSYYSKWCNLGQLHLGIFEENLAKALGFMLQRITFGPFLGVGHSPTLQMRQREIGSPRDVGASLTPGWHQGSSCQVQAQPLLLQDQTSALSWLNKDRNQK